MLDFFSSLTPPCLELGHFFVASAGLTLVTLFHAARMYGLVAGAHVSASLEKKRVDLGLLFSSRDYCTSTF